MESAHRGFDANNDDANSDDANNDDSLGDTSSQEPPGTAHVQANEVLQHHNKITILFAFTS